MMEFEIAKYLNFYKICVYCTQCTRWSKCTRRYHLSLLVIGRLVSMRYIIIHIFCSIKQIFSLFNLLNLIKINLSDRIAKTSLTRYWARATTSLRTTCSSSRTSWVTWWRRSPWGRRNWRPSRETESRRITTTWVSNGLIITWGEFLKKNLPF